jgi:DNA-binding transcriptional LysR family regulator
MGMNKHVRERFGRRLKLRDLNIFLAVARERNMSKAAAALAISQPAVSRAISDMERDLGVPLLDRHPHGVEPTLYGRSLIKRGTVIFDEIRQSVKDIEFLADPTAGEIRLGCTPPLAAGIMPAIIETLNRRYPRVVLQVTPGNVNSLQRELHGRNIELAMWRTRSPVSDEDMEAQVLFRDRSVVVAGSRSKWTRRQRIDLAELLEEPWILPPSGAMSDSSIDNPFRFGEAVVPRATVSSTSMAMTMSLLAGGRFLSLLPESMLRLAPNYASVKVLPVKLRVPARLVTIAALKHRTLSPAAQLFIACARDVTKTIGLPRADQRSRANR